MALKYEFRHYAECDKCNCWTSKEFVTQNKFKNYLRDNGWSVGKKVLCPNCTRNKYSSNSRKGERRR